MYQGSKLVFFGGLFVSSLTSFSVSAQNNTDMEKSVTYRVYDTQPRAYSGQRGAVHVIAEDKNNGLERVVVMMQEKALQPFERELRQGRFAGSALSATLQQEFKASLQSQAEKIQAAQKNVMASITAAGIKHKVHHQFSRQVNAISMSVSPKQKAELKKLPGVKAVVADQVVQAYLDKSVPHLRIPELWEREDGAGNALTGKNIKVGIIDTGIDYQHSDLGGCLGASCKVAGGYDFVNMDSDPMDDNGHGTHVAGTVAANGTMKGVAPDATLYGYKVLGANGSGWDSDIAAAVEMSVEQGMDVINLSLGGGGGPDSLSAITCDEAMLSGVVVVVAAGNSGPGYETVGSPGNAKEVITVGASDLNDQLADFSSRGPVPGYSYPKPEIVAPGVNIVAPMPSQSYAALSGTSMASPHVAGVVALLRQFRPDLTAQQVKSVLLSQSKDLGLDTYSQGVGLIQPVDIVDNHLLSSPTGLNFGSINGQTDSWTGQAELILQNISATSVKYQLAVADSLPEGLELEGLPEGEISLAAGASRTFKLSLIADNKVLGYPESGNGAFHLALQLESENETRKIPMIAQRNLTLTVEQPQGNIWSTHLINTESGSTRTLSFMMEPSVTLRVAPGDYHLLVASQVNGLTSLYVKENITIDQDFKFTIDPDEYQHKFGLGSIVDENSQRIDPYTLNSKASMVTARYLPMDYGDTTFYMFMFGGGSKILQTNRVSESFAVGVSALMVDESKPTSTNYFHYDKQSIGVTSSAQFSVDGREFAPVLFETGNIGRSFAFDVFFSGVDGALGGAAAGNPREQNIVQRKLYMVSAERTTDSRHPQFYASKDGLKVFDTSPMSRDRESGFIKLMRGWREIYNDVVFRSEHSYLSSTTGPLFSSFEMNYLPQDGSLELLSDQIFTGLGLKDEFANYYHQPLALSLNCDGEKSDYVLNSTQGELPFPGNCELFKLSFNYSNQAGESDKTSKVTLETAGRGKVPALSMVQFLDNGKPSRSLRSAEPEMRISLTKDGKFIENGELKVYYRLAGSTKWLSLSSIEHSEQFRIALPKLNDGGRASFKIEFSDDVGNRVVHELNSVVYLDYQPPKYQISVGKNGDGAGLIESDTGGIQCGSSCSTSLEAGTQITLSATPDQSSTFKAWSSGPCSGQSESCLIDLSKDTYVEARFDLKTFVPEIISVAPEQGEVKSLTEFVSYGSSIRYQVTAAKGYKVKAVVGGSCPAGRWLDKGTYETGPITAACSVHFEFVKSRRDGLPLWLLLQNQ